MSHLRIQMSRIKQALSQVPAQSKVRLNHYKLTIILICHSLRHLWLWIEWDDESNYSFNSLQLGAADPDFGEPENSDEDELAELGPRHEPISNLDPLRFTIPNANVGPDCVHNPDDIMISCHPSSGHDTPEFLPFDEYCSFKFDSESGDGPTSDSDDILLPELVKSKQPWKPFHTRLDFEVAEVMLSAHMNKRQTETTIQLFNHVKGTGRTDSDFTLVDHSDLSLIWDHA